MIRQRIEQIRQKIDGVCKRIGRDPREIILIGVTKYTSPEKIHKALAGGITHIGENKVQDAQLKFPALDSFIKSSSFSVTKHMIGHLQTNKVKTALSIFDVLQSVDSLKLAQEVEKQAAKLEKTAEIFIEVNTVGEEEKYGVPKTEALKLIESVAAFPHIRISGLMTMAPFVDDKSIIRRCFRDLREIRDQARQKFKDRPRIDLKYLSMGMTQDYEIALEEGSNMLRIGRAIFGE